MRLLRIHIKNLNALRTQVTIDFTAPPLMHADIFAITGNTGSGKTTLLDAITLALYGKVARDRDAHKEVMSYGATEAQAELEFVVEAERYLASWRIHRARHKLEGRILAPQRELAKWSEEKLAFLPIAEKIKDVDEAVVRITKLDFERFTRSVLLAQGDFAAFLKANEKERSELLERITGTDIYSRLSTAAFVRYRLEEQSLKSLQEQQKQLGLLDGESVEKAQLVLAQSELDKQQTATAALREKVQRIDRWLETQRRLETLASEQTKVNEAIAAFATQQVQLDKSLALQPLRSDFQALVYIANQQTSTQERLAADEQAVTVGKTRWEQLAQAVAEAEAHLKATRIRHQQQEENLRAVERLDEQILQAQEKLQDLQAQQAPLIQNQQERQDNEQALAELRKSLTDEQLTLASWLKEHADLSTLPANLGQIEEIRDQLLKHYFARDERHKKQQELEQQLVQAQKHADQLEATHTEQEQAIKFLQQQSQKVLPDHFVEEDQSSSQQLSAAIVDLQEQQQRLFQLRDLDEAYQELLREQAQHQDRLAKLEGQQRENNLQQLNLLEQTDELKAVLTYKRTVYEQQQRVANYAKDRQDLQPGDPCPLCLSTDHPFHEHPVEAFVDRARVEMEAAHQAYETAEQQLRELVRKDSDLNKEIELLRGDDLQALAGRIDQQQKRLLGFEEKIAGLLIGKPAEWSSIRGNQLADRLQALDHQLEQWRTAQQQLTQLDDQRLALDKKQQQTERNYHAAQQDLKVLQSQLAETQQRWQEHNEAFAREEQRINEQLQPWGHQFALATAKNTFAELRVLAEQITVKQDRHNALQAELQVNQERLAANGEALAALAAQLEQQQAQLSTTNKQLTDWQAERQTKLGDQKVAEVRAQLQQELNAAELQLETTRQTANAAKEAQAAREQSVKDATVKLTELAAQKATQAEQLQQALTPLGYATMAAAQAVLLPESEQQTLQTQAQQLQQQQAEVRRALAEAEKTAAAYAVEAKLNTVEQEESRTALATSETDLQAQLLAFGQLQEKYRQQEERRQQHEALLQKITAQRTEFNRWANLNEVIGQRDGKKFRSFAQGLTLQRLIVLANLHLERLNGRYLIDKKDDSDLELEIIDTFQADNRRSVFTLSGGESFLISLALALGLSDLAGQHAQIQSLFIDEGFGTLDEHSLDLALDTLENLQSTGKTIGIISHVKALKERIGTQIQLRKGPDGFSTVLLK